MVTTTTTLPTSRPIDDASSGERIEPKAEEADMRELALCAARSASSSAFQLRSRVDAHMYLKILNKFG
jgi:hypothetical protein